MDANVITKKQIVSSEQRMIERATAEYISKLRAILGKSASATLTIQGVPLSKLGIIAEFLENEEEEPIKIKRYKPSFGDERNYIYHSIKGDGFCIEEISE